MLAGGSSPAGSTITVADGLAHLRDAHGASWADGAAATSLPPTRPIGVAASGPRHGGPADLVLVNGGAVAGVMRAGQ